MRPPGLKTRLLRYLYYLYLLMALLPSTVTFTAMWECGKQITVQVSWICDEITRPPEIQWDLSSGGNGFAILYLHMMHTIKLTQASPILQETVKSNSLVCERLPGRHGPCGWGRVRLAQSGWAGCCRQREAPWCQRTAAVYGNLAAGLEMGEEKGEVGETGQMVTQGRGCSGRRPQSPCWAWSLCSKSPPRRRYSPSHSYAYKQRDRRRPLPVNTEYSICMVLSKNMLM